MYRNLVSIITRMIVAGALLAPAGSLVAQDTKPDNSAANKQDHNSSQPTADQAKNSMSDREMMKNIRHDLVNDKSLSTYGHNVKIIANHGKVTLRGPVHSAEEKNSIEEHARKYAGDGNIVNELTVKGDQK
jgi:hyperosmotically inducible periplasmic protein